MSSTSQEKAYELAYAMNYSYGSHTVTLVSICAPLLSQKNKLNVNTMCIYKNNINKNIIASSPADKLDGGALKFLKKSFFTIVGDKHLTDNYSDNILRLVLQI